jgi:hypothetical protein
MDFPKVKTNNGYLINPGSTSHQPMVVVAACNFPSFWGW